MPVPAASSLWGIQSEVRPPRHVVRGLITLLNQVPNVRVVVAGSSDGGLGGLVFERREEAPKAWPGGEGRRGFSRKQNK